MKLRRTLIVGTGSIAAAHATAVAGRGGRAVVVAGVDLEPARARDFAARHGIEGWSADLDTALAQTWADSGRLDLAHICTPPSSHAPLAVQCLRAGVPVLLEKPPALSLAQVDELLAVSESTGVDVAVAFQHRFGSGARRARALLAVDGAPEQGIGRPLVATSHTLWYRDAEYFAVPWRGHWDVEGGGPTMGDGTPVRSSAGVARPLDGGHRPGRTPGAGHRTADVSMAVVRFASGALATVVNSVVSPRQTSSLRIDTERATLEVEHLYGYTDADWTFTAAPGHEELAALWTTDDTAPRSSHTCQMAALLDAMDAGEPLPVPLREVRSTMELVAAIYASAFTGKVVR